ncbi:MAG: guanylate kinase [Omnitrophica bacterium]|nr:guanylate kinase [Candidatus Omnitrophota bacterium]
MKSLREKLRKGKLFIISAPSGSGKTTLCQKLILGLSGKRRLVSSISTTTRKIRKGETQGEDYFFISQAQFLKKRRKGEFLEWAKVLGNFYGTPREFVHRQINCGRDVLLSIDVQGARKIKRKVSDAILIFILPPSVEELARRLNGRSTESSKEISRRLKLAKREIARAREYDYVVLNDKISKALVKLKKIIQLERRKKP